MNRHCVLGIIVMALGLLGSAANAQLFRAYLSVNGSDANPCTVQQPCRLLPAALAAVTSGGEIWILDSGNYNAATVAIGKSVSILAVPGAVGSVVAVSGPAISITAPSLTIALHNVAIVPYNAATDGVQLTAASTLIIENSLIANLPGNGVYVSGNGTLRMTESIVRNSGTGIRIVDGGTGDVSSTKILQCTTGALAMTTVPATTRLRITDVVVSGGSYGVESSTTVSSASTSVYITRSTIQGASLYGVTSTTSAASAFSFVTLNGNAIIDNGFGWFISGTNAVITSMLNNEFQNNNSSSGSFQTLNPI